MLQQQQQQQQQHHQQEHNKAPLGPRRSTAIQFVLLLTFISTSHASFTNESTPACFPACGPLGSCVRDPSACGEDNNSDCQHFTCQCLDGYTGKDCSLRAPDVCHVSASAAKAELHVDKCLNGGVCSERKSEGGRVWAICKCDGAFGASGLSKENTSCSYKVSDICEAGAHHSEYAYCYNGGVCLGTVSRPDHEPHPGCDCSGTGFAGRHCQFPVENVPIEEEVFAATGGKDIISNHDINASTKQSTSSPYRSVDDASPSKTGFWVLSLVGIVAFVAFSAHQRRYRRSRRRELVFEDHGVELEDSSSSDDSSWDAPVLVRPPSLSMGGDRNIC